MSDPQQPAMPPGMSIPVLPQAPQPVSGIEGGLQGAARVADTVGGAIQMATQVSQAAQGISADQLVSQVAGGVGMALGGASSFVSGMDPGVSQALGVVSAGVSAFGGVVGMVRSAVDAIEGAVSEANRHRVTFEFESGATPDATWMVVSWTLDERIGRPYCATVVLACEDLEVDAPSMLGVNAKLVLRRGEDHERIIGGLVQRVELGRSTDRARIVTVEIVPALALLALKKDTRIFQHDHVLAILDNVLSNALEGYARSIDIRARRSYFRREYCVQYGETDLDFVHRLMEEEGITYFFEWQSDGTEKMVIVDGRDGMPSLLPDDESIPFVQQRNETSDTEHIHELAAATQLRTTSFALQDLDWTQIGERARIDAHVRIEGPNGMSRERYDHDRAVTLGAYEKLAYGRSDAEHRLATRRQAHEAEARTLRGAANVIRMMPGHTITVSGHPVQALDGELLVLAVSHRGHSPELRDLLGHAQYAHDDVSYECSFEAIPEGVPYRMRETTPKPRVNGMLSAIVVGASGQEIHSDEHRRVRVQFRWDREHLFDEESSCYVRVMQTWAGQGFGSLFLPRVGMEVAVMFLDGDPDRPMIAGCLYDQDNPPPYTTEADWTKSTLRSKSSPFPKDGDEHFNELRFEDATGSEEVFLHAEKDLNEVVKHDHSTHVGRNQSNTVDVDQHETIGRDVELEVGRHRRKTIDHSEWVTIHENRETQIDGSDARVVKGELRDEIGLDTTAIHHQKRSTLVKGAENVELRAGRSVFVTGDDQSTSTTKKLIYADGSIRLGAQQQHEVVLRDGVLLQSPDVVSIVVGSNIVAVHSDGRVVVSSTKRIDLEAGPASITLQASGSVNINGPSGVTLSCGQSSVELTPMGVTTSGTQLTSSATADHTITGMIVRIN